MKIVFMGTPDFAAGILKAIHAAGHEVTGVVTQPDKPKGRKKELVPSPVKEEALAIGCPVLQPARIRAEEAKAAVMALEADAVVVAAFPKRSWSGRSTAVLTYTPRCCRLTAVRRRSSPPCWRALVRPV